MGKQNQDRINDIDFFFLFAESKDLYLQEVSPSEDNNDGRMRTFSAM